jgi:hypothetical protein
MDLAVSCPHYLGFLWSCNLQQQQSEVAVAEKL